MKYNKQFVIQYFFFLSLLLIGSANLKAQDDLNLQAMIQEVDSNAIFIDSNYYHWCNSVIKGEDGKYHMFYARWSHGKRTLDDDSLNYIFDGFRGWNKYSEIAYAVSDNMLGPYHYVKTVLKGNFNNSWDKYTMHNCQIRKFGKYYYLYYISNSYDSTLTFSNSKFSKDWIHWLQYNCTQKIGVVKAKSINDLINGKYEKPAGPIMQPNNVNTFEVTTNPTVTQGPDGKYYMMYKSRKPNVGHMTFWMAVCDKPDGNFTQISEVFNTADMACEDPCMWYDQKRKRFYAAVKYYSNSKKLVPQFGALALVTSEDGMHWTPANHPVISLRELKLKNKEKIELAHLERPFIVTDKTGNPMALFAAASIKEPTVVNNPTNEQNSFIVGFNLQSPNKKK